MDQPQSAAGEKIFYCKPSITAREISYATDAATHGWGERCYEYIDRFEHEFAKYIGAGHAIATSSCTGALHMGLSALGIGIGDEVIIGDTNWIASVAPVIHVGATPVFVDILEDSWCLDPEKVEAAITPRTKAIIAVHLYGNLCDMNALEAISKRHGLALIEDAAEAIGSRWSRQRAGARGLFSTFSFHGTKTLTTGEGGMFVTQDSNLHQRVLTLSNHGRVKGQSRQFWPEHVGFKYKMSNLQAAIGCAQLERIEDLVAGKRRVFAYYADKLQGLPIKLNPEPAGTVNGFWMPTIVVDRACNVSSSLMLAEFMRENIDARSFFWPLSMLPMFSAKPQNKISYDLCERSINLPSYHDLTESQMDRVVGVVKRILGR